MTLDALIMAAGGFIVALPFLGFPHSWDTWLYSIVGVCVVGLGIALRRRGGKPITTSHDTSTTKKKSFVESAPQQRGEIAEVAGTARSHSDQLSVVHENA